MYKIRFVQWGWRKYEFKPRRGSSAASKVSTRSQNNSQPKNTQARKEATTEMIETKLTAPMLHQNDDARHVSTMLAVVRQYMNGSADHIKRPPWMGWTATSKFDTPPYSSGDDWTDRYLVPVHLALRSALWSFDSGDAVGGGRLLRRAFRMLDEKLRSERLIPPSYICSILAALVEAKRFDLGKMFLEFVVSRISVQACRHPLVLVCKLLLSAIDRGHCTEFLIKSIDVEARSLADVRGMEHHQDTTEFWSLPDKAIYCPGEVVYGMVSRVERAGRILPRYVQLLQHAKANLGDLHHACLSLETAIIIYCLQQGVQRTFAPELGARLVARLEQYYGERGVAFESWESEHYQPYVDSCVELVISHYLSGRTDQAIKIAHKLAGLPTVVSEGVRGGIHTMLFYCQLYLEKIGKLDEADELKRTRISSNYYTSLETEFATEEREFASRVQKQDPTL